MHYLYFFTFFFKKIIKKIEYSGYKIQYKANNTI